jgi:hypothetical protein
LKENEVHLVITDIVMPNMDGLSLLKQLKFEKPEVPIIVISGFSSQNNIDMSYKYYAEKFFSKPFKWDELIEAVRHSKKIYEKNMMSKSFPDLVKINSEIKISDFSSKQMRFLMEKIISLLSNFFLVSYDISTEYYIILDEIFLICKKISRILKKENHLIFKMEQIKYDVLFKIFDNDNVVNFNEFLKNEEAAVKSIKKYAKNFSVGENGKSLKVTIEII